MNFEELKTSEEFEGARPANPNAWLMSLTDLMSLVLSFFVLLYSTKDMPQEKYEELKSSFKKYLKEDSEAPKYQFKEQASGKVSVVKKATDISYLENVLKNALADYPQISILGSENKIRIAIRFDKEITPQDSFSNDITDEISVLSKILTPLNNQLQIIVNAENTNESARLGQIVSEKLTDFGYEKNILVTLSEENIEKDKNKVRITILVNSYENIF